jgi:hypothetical protein
MKTFTNSIYVMLAVATILLYLTCSSLSAKMSSNYKLYGISSHIGRDVFINFGAEYDHDIYLNDWLLLRGAIASYQDTAKLMAGFIHFGFRIEAKKFERLYIRFGVGPTFIWRQSHWKYGAADYQGNEFYGSDFTEAEYETAFLWYAGDIEVEYRFSDNMGVIFSVIPGFPVVINTNAGIRITY